MRVMSASTHRQTRSPSYISAQTKCLFPTSRMQDEIKHALALQPFDDGTLTGYMNHCIGLDNRLFKLRGEEKASKPKPSAPKNAGPKPYVPPPPAPSPSIPSDNRQYIPMDLSASRGKVAPQERERRRKMGLCYYCGEAGHQANAHRSTVKAVDEEPVAKEEKKDFSEGSS